MNAGMFGEAETRRTNRRKRRGASAVVGMNLTPMIDMFTTILIFLMCQFGAEQIQIEKDAKIELPEATAQIKDVPKIQLEIKPNQMKLNGKILSGLDPSSSTAEWSTLQSAMMQSFHPADIILLIADKKLPYAILERTASRLTEAGFTQFYLLTEKKEASE